MRALFDGGTTRLHVGFWKDGRLVAIEHRFYPVDTGSLAAIVEECVAGWPIESVAACSVSKVWREPLFEVLAALFPGRLVVARTAADLSLRVAYEHPETYGIDRSLAAAAAWRRFGDACVVADAGTALTVDAVDRTGAVAGGYIMPGFGMQSSVLAQVTGLPRAAPDVRGDLLGTDTISAIRLGIGYGYPAAAEQLIRLAAGAVDAGDRILLTGGEADLLAPVMTVGGAEPVVVPGLVLEGLALSAHRLPRFS